MTTWQNILNEEFNKKYFKGEIVENLKKEYDNHTIFPLNEDLFNAFSFDYKKLKVVILGQDPYYTMNYKYNDQNEKVDIPTMHGLAFSTLGINRPPSLNNIFKELAQEYKDYSIPETNDLTYWKNQGVLLLNVVLTVRKGEANSHSKKIGWEKFTSNIIKKITSDHENLVFLLWGKNAKEQKPHIMKQENHLILESSHPSPFSYNISFKENNHFIETNRYLNERNKIPINWQTK